MGKILCVPTVLFLFFFLTFMKVEVHGTEWSCPVAEQSVGQDFYMEEEHWTVCAPYLFFTFDYIAPFFLVVTADDGQMCAACAFASEKSVSCPGIWGRSVAELFRPSVSSGNYMGRDYYVFALHRIVV